MLTYRPMSHRFVERLIGSIRREPLDPTFFWTSTELGKKLRDYCAYYKKCQAHSGFDGVTPVEREDKTVIAVNHYRWERALPGDY